MDRPLPLSCQWTTPPIDIEGLDEGDKRLIHKYGFEKWMWAVEQLRKEQEKNKNGNANRNT